MGAGTCWNWGGGWVGGGEGGKDHRGRARPAGGRKVPETTAEAQRAYPTANPSFPLILCKLQ